MKMAWTGKTVFLLAAATLVAPRLLLAQVDPNFDVKMKVQEAFSDVPEMVAVAKCESGYRQFGADGTALRGGGGKGYIGIFQISERLHTQKALSLSFDIKTIEGNIGYARYLYSKNGLSPWLDCLKPKSQAVSTTTPSGLTINLRFGMSHPDVITLQKALHQAGFAVAPSGGGSPGNETPYFGALTREAVRRFQCAKGIVCEGNESTTGYGRVGPMTRSALAQTTP